MHQKIRLTERSEETLELSVIGMISGLHYIRGLRLVNFNNLEVFYENDMAVTITNEAEVKTEEQIFNKTDVFDIFDLAA